MGFIGGKLGYGVLKRLGSTGFEEVVDKGSYVGRSKLDALLGAGFWDDIKGKAVIDFGCGAGAQAVEMAQRGAARVIGVDIVERHLAVARESAMQAGVDARCVFAVSSAEPVDVIVAVDSFEHFSDPEGVLRAMRGSLKPDGCVHVSFGPTWYHPLGGHLFSVVPWAHLVFTEKALMRWRADSRHDGATRFEEVEGGLNKMTLRRFERIVAESPFRFEEFEAIPIRKLGFLQNRFTREFTTAIVRCKLVPRDGFLPV